MDFSPISVDGGGITGGSGGSSGLELLQENEKNVPKMINMYLIIQLKITN